MKKMLILLCLFPWFWPHYPFATYAFAADSSITRLRVAAETDRVGCQSFQAAIRGLRKGGDPRGFFGALRYYPGASPEFITVNDADWIAYAASGAGYTSCPVGIFVDGYHALLETGWSPSKAGIDRESVTRQLLWQADTALRSAPPVPAVVLPIFEVLIELAREGWINLSIPAERNLTFLQSKIRDATQLPRKREELARVRPFVLEARKVLAAAAPSS